ncbi:hypothetical protein SAMN05421676_103344 [Salinibacillus kushneri]|uniref:Uncharacterized protein n=1 Tax=Salinibacillus kushneri TaxID=237682 RepID=A0A1I0D0M1_9BACI|nr:hypothetical protein SAMN05421676_103344 [Salinibacillus kushneri]
MCCSKELEAKENGLLDDGQVFCKYPRKITLSHFTPLRDPTQGGEWCARLHQRTYDQDRKIYRGDKEDGPGDRERIWRFQEYGS